MNHGTRTAESRRYLWRWAATLALLLTLLGSSFAQVSAAATPQPQTAPPADRTVAPHEAGAAGIAAPGGGTAVGWGRNRNLQLCNGDFNSNSVGLAKPNAYLSGVTAVAAGSYHALYLLSDGTVYTCGYEDFGALGTGRVSNADYGVPQQVLGVCPSASPAPSPSPSPSPNHTATECGYLTNIKAIAAGPNHSLALDTAGNVYTWGDNSAGELGTGTTTGPETCRNGSSCSTTPVRVPGLTNVIQIVAGNYFSVALKGDGSVWAFGDDGLKQLGHDPATDQYCPNNNYSYNNSCQPTPMQVQGLPKIVQIATGMGAYHVLAGDATGHVWAWGANGEGQLGRGTTSLAEPTPAQVVGPGGTAVLGGGGEGPVALPHAAHPYFERLGASQYSSYAVVADGTVYSWGANDSGQLGIGTTTGQPGLASNACTPTYYSWDSNNNCYTFPVHVKGVDGTGYLGNIVSLGSGGGRENSYSRSDTIYAITSNSYLYSWGDNSNYQLGIGVRNGYRSTPMQVLNGSSNGPLTGVLSVSAATSEYALAVIAAPQTTYTITSSVTGSGTVTPSGATSYPAGTVASYSATAAAGQTFVGWSLDGTYVGFANPLTLTANANHTLVAKFVATPTFTDISTLSAADQRMITFLAAIGIVNPRGVNGSGQFQPTRGVARAEVAAFIARTFGWESEFHGNTFPDLCLPNDQTNCVDQQLWNDVAALRDYGVVGGYPDAATCAAVGTTAPCYKPRQIVLRVQVVSIVARAFTKAPDLRPTGFWGRLAANMAQYTNVSTDGSQRSDLTTYRANAGTIPGQTSDTTFPNPLGDGSRLFMVQVLYQAYSAQYGVDRTP